MPILKAYVRAAAAAVGVLALVFGTFTPVEASAARRRGVDVTVMTRNVYLGGDITRPIAAAAGKTGPAALLALGHANHELRTIVDQTSFPTRSRLLAREIADARPDLVGLQEVAIWRQGPLELDRLGVLNAAQVDYDFLAILLSDLRGLGVRYQVASAQVETDVEAPAFLGDPFHRTASQERDVRLTLRDVMLVRHNSGLKVEDTGGGRYEARLNANVGGLPLSIVRGHAWVDVRKRATRLRAITTHLESQSSDLAFAQARELLSGPARTRKPTVILCDCNSDPLNNTVRPGDHVPHNAAYQLITGSRFRDLWLRQRHPVGPGWTAGLSERVNDPTADRFNRRIDMVFGRSSALWNVPVRRGSVTGDSVADRDPGTGLWPSDHAGVVVKLRVTRRSEAMTGTRAAMAALAADPSQQHLDQARTAFATLSDVIETHFTHEERDLEPMMAESVDTPQMKRAQQQIRKTQSLPSAGVYFAWLLDDADPDARAYIGKLLPKPVLFLLSSVLGRPYSRVASVWG